MRIVIVGGPRTGKTTLSRTYPGECLHTDDLIPLGWSAASDRVCEFLSRPGPWVVEGVAAVRGIRKWLDKHRTGRPCDTVISLGRARVHMTPGQERMAKACDTIWYEVFPVLCARGVTILSQ